MRRDLHALLDALGFPPSRRAETDSIAREYSADEHIAAFLGRSLQGHSIESATVCVNTFDRQLVEDWTRGEACDEDVARMFVFADDSGDRVFLLDPQNRLGLGPHAVYTVEKGAMTLDSVEWVSTTIEAFLSLLLDDGELPTRRIVDIRDEQTAGTALPLRLGDGRELPGDVVTDPRYHVGADVLRSVRLTRPLTLGVTYVPRPDRAEWQRHPDLSFFRSGHVETGYAEGGRVADHPVAAGSCVTWADGGRLLGFTPAEGTVVNGVRVMAGVPVWHKGETFFFTPAEDTVWKGFLCKAGAKVDDYGPGLGWHFTTGKAFSFKGQPVPADVRVTVMGDGGLRFTLVSPLLVGARMLPAGASLWYAGDGRIHEIYVPNRG